jgi:hypothetical protein
MPESAPGIEIRPAGVNLAAAILSLLVLFGVLVLAGAVVALFLTRNPLIPRVASVRIILASFDLLVLIFLCWCACTVAGLFRLRSWARYSMIVIGALDFIVFSFFCAAMLLARRNPIVIGMDAHPSPAVPFPVGAVITAFAVLYGIIALVGLWWMVYFNLSPVRTAFAAANRTSLPNPSARLTP